MSTARERIQAYLDRIDAQNAKSSLKYHDTIHGLDDIELTRTDLRALLAETAPTEDVREAAPAPVERVRQLIRDLVDPDDCWFDHHGGCQAHGYLSLKPGEMCPHAEAKQMLAEWEPVDVTPKEEQ